MEVWIEVCDGSQAMVAIKNAGLGTLVYASTMPETGEVRRHLVSDSPPPFSQSPGKTLDSFAAKFVVVFIR